MIEKAKVHKYDYNTFCYMVLIMVLIDLIFPKSVLFSNLTQMTRQRHYQAIDKHRDVPKYYPWYLFR